MRQKWIRRVLIAVAVILIFAGVLRNDVNDVMNKAIRICYECIGIG